MVIGVHAIPSATTMTIHMSNYCISRDRVSCAGANWPWAKLKNLVAGNFHLWGSRHQINRSTKMLPTYHPALKEQPQFLAAEKSLGTRIFDSSQVNREMNPKLESLQVGFWWLGWWGYVGILEEKTCKNRSRFKFLATLLKEHNTF